MTLPLELALPEVASQFEPLPFAGEVLLAFPRGRHEGVQSRPAKVSVCLPVYNGGKELARCIESVLRQTCSDFQLLIVDNNSTDDTLATACRYALEHPNVVVYQNASNLGRIPNWNRCLELARGAYVKLMMAKDFLFPAYLERLVAVMDADPRVVLARASLARLTSDGAVRLEPLFETPRRLSGQEAIAYSMMKGNIAAGPTAQLLRRDPIVAEGLRFDEGLSWAADFDFALRLLAGRDGRPRCFFYLPEKLFAFDATAERTFNARSWKTLYQEEWAVRQRVLQQSGPSIAAPLVGQIVENLVQIFDDCRRQARTAGDAAAEAELTQLHLQTMIELVSLTANPRDLLRDGPRVAVVIPCYKQAHYLSQAVASVVEQTYQSWECIVVNDGSPDDTSAVVEQLIARYPDRRIRLVERPNGGLAAARNTGIEAAEAELILPLDADDLLHPQLMSKAVEVLVRDPRAAIAYYDAIFFGETNQHYQAQDWNPRKLCEVNLLYCCAMFRREAWKTVGGYNSNMREGYEDWDFWVGCAEKGFYGRRIPEPLFLYRTKRDSMYQDALGHDMKLRAQMVRNHPSLYPPEAHSLAEEVLRREEKKSARRAAGEGPVRVCIATRDIQGPVRNGGIGTALTGLAEALAEAGHEVTILYTAGDYTETTPVTQWVTSYARRGIRFVPLELRSLKGYPGRHPLAMSYSVYLWLKEHDAFDVIHFHDWHGCPFYTVLAKHQGLAFSNTRICVGAHSPTRFLKGGAQETFYQPEELILDFLEQESLALADAVVSPSRYLLDWMRGEGWRLPSDTAVLSNLLPASSRPAQSNQDFAVRPIREIVFFGRLERLKGVELFCDAIDHLAQIAPGQATVTFLGKPVFVNDQDSLSYIKERGHDWPFPCRAITQLGQKDAVAYLQGEGRLAVLASHIENSPCAVVECLDFGIPFLASRVGGIPELIHPDDVDASCYPRTAEELARRLAVALAHGHRPAHPAKDHAAKERSWLAWHDQRWRQPVIEREEHRQTVNAEEATPLISVCIPHRNRPEYLRRALRSIEAQDYPRVEVIIVDDGSDTKSARAMLDGLSAEAPRRGWQLIRRTAGGSAGAARNTAARHAQGEYLLFMDDDNIAKPEEVSTMVKVARQTGADILTCFMDTFEGEEPSSHLTTLEARWPFLGAASAVGLFCNCFGDTNALIRRSTFSALGGFTEDRGLSHEDWELYAKAVLQGFRLETIPEALFWYRQSASGVSGRSSFYENHQRSLRPYLAAAPGPLRDVMLYAHGLTIQHAVIAKMANYYQQMLPLLTDLGAANLIWKLGHSKIAMQLINQSIRAAREQATAEVAVEVMCEVSRVLAANGEVAMAMDALGAAQSITVQSKNRDLDRKVRSLIATLRESEPPRDTAAPVPAPPPPAASLRARPPELTARPPAV